MNIMEQVKEAALEILRWDGINGAYFALGDKSILFFEEQKYHPGKKFSVRTYYATDGSLHQDWAENETFHVSYRYYQDYTTKEYYDAETDIYSLSTDMVIVFMTHIVGNTNLLDYRLNIDDTVGEPMSTKDIASKIVDQIREVMDEEGTFEENDEDED